MKKTLIVLSSIIALSLFTGCKKSKVLECTLSQGETGYSMKGTEKITFKGSSVEDYSAIFTLELDDDYVAYKDMIVASFESQMDQYKNIKGVDLKTEKTDNGVKVTMTADVQNMSGSGLKSLELSKKASYDATKKDREKNGYNCK